jgi:ATP-dependent DNA helicase RecQ
MAKNLGVDEKELIKQLEYLDQVGILAYDKRKDMPQITFLTERFDAGKLPLNKKRIEDRRQNAISKAKSMIAYVGNTGACRSNQISFYFGENSDQNCGICDVCLENKKSDEVFYQKVKKKIFQTLTDGIEFSLNTIKEVPGLDNKKRTIEVLREMEEEGLIFTLPDGIYKIKS